MSAPTPAVLAQRTTAGLTADPSRVVARLFLPGEEAHVARSRSGVIVERFLSFDDTTVQTLLDGLLADFGRRHFRYAELLLRHAAIVAGHVGEHDLSEAHMMALGACFTAEYATEAAALCNPSAVPHIDQTDLEPGQLRVAVSLRAIGEGHVSSIGFCTAVIGPGAQWTFDDRDTPLSAGTPGAALWRNEQLRAVLSDQGTIDELSNGLLHALPAVFDASDLERELAHTPSDLLLRAGSYASVDVLRRVVSSAYEVQFHEDTTLAQRILLPSAEEESDGMEDARFTRFVHDDGTVEYRATYTAYDGTHIAPRLILSDDLRHFRMHRLAGPAARNKGMALFPRLVHDRHLALCRTDGENLSVSTSDDGYTWASPQPLHAPIQLWELLQVGNCGPPIETEFGWLVLTHGVGPMRVYAIGAILLDRDDPSRVIGRLDSPLIAPASDERDGYVPNVVYSCGAVVHDGRLWIPYGIDDSRIGVAWVSMDALLDALTPTTSRTATQPASSVS